RCEAAAAWSARDRTRHTLRGGHRRQRSHMTAGEVGRALIDRGVDGRRKDDAQSDAAASQLLAERLGESQQPELARHIRRDLRRADPGVERTDEDEGSASLLAEYRQNGASAVHLTEEVRLDDLPED